jgi:MoaA/NifB/PqqE/SkfB family radical SAM enzyme
MTQNIAEMEEVHRLAREFGFGHNITLAAQYHEGRIAKSTDLQDSLPFAALEGMDEATIRNIYDRINALKHDRYNRKMNEKQSSTSLRDLVEAYLNEGGRNRLLFRKEMPKPLCTAFFTHLRLLPYGDLVSCSIRRKRIVANVRDKSFSEIWYSVAAQKERNAVKACKGCWSECDITPSIFYSGDIISWYLKKKLRGKVPGALEG